MIGLRGAGSWIVLGVLALGCGSKPAAKDPLLGPDFGKGKKPATNDPGITVVGPISEDVRSRVEGAWRIASKARRLKPKESVKLQVLDPKALVAVVRTHVDNDVPKDVIKGEGTAYTVLGLLPAGFDYEAETYSLLEEELAGLYMPEHKTMYVASGIKGSDLESTLAHELVHALQDQHFGIGKKMKYDPNASESIAAVHALAEGDATSAMFDGLIMMRSGDEGLSGKKATDLPDLDPEQMVEMNKKTKKRPRFLSLGLVAPYADGMRFVHALRRRGGWAAVDEAWQKPPQSTEQLLHLDKYDAQEPPIAVAAPSANALGPGFKKTFEDVFGEEEGRIALAEWMDVKTSKKAAAGWGGDRLALYEDGKDKAVAWKIVFDDEKEAEEAMFHLVTGWGARFGGPTLDQVDHKAWGAVPLPPPPAPPKDPKADPKKDPKKDPPKEPPKKVGDPLPQLPDAPGYKPIPQLTGCRLLRRSGKTVALLAGAPCGKIVAWGEEVVK